MRDFHSGRGTEGDILNAGENPVNTTRWESTNRGYTFGIAGLYRFNSRFGIRSGISFTSHTATRIDTGPNAQVIWSYPWDPNRGEQIREEVTWVKGKWEYKYTTIDLLADIGIADVGPGRLWGGIGVSFGWEASGSSRVPLMLVESWSGYFLNPDGLPTEDNGRTLVLHDEDDLSVSSRTSLRGGLAYDLPLFGPLHIRPGITFDYGLGSVREDPEWNMNSLVGQLDILMEL